MACVSLKNISKVYDKNIEAVHDFSLEIADREFVVLVGPSGCGKSTTLRMIAGLEDISGGELYIGDKRMNGVPPKDRDIAMVFQNYALYPHMTAYENMAFGLRLKKAPKPEIDHRVREAARVLDIEPLLDRTPKTLSGGERQRVAIGRAIVRSPQAFLMDEPLSNLDATMRHQMRIEIRKLRELVDTTFVYVTHDQTEAMTLGDRIVVMRNGVIEQIGTPSEVFNRPANLFVATFIGSPQMNLFEAMLCKRSGTYFIRIADAAIPLTTAQQSAAVSEQAVIVGIRPEYLRLTDDEQSSIPCVVRMCEELGSSLLLHIDVSSTQAAVLLQTQKLPSGHTSKSIVGEQIKIAFDTKNIHLFDPQSKLNLGLEPSSILSVG